MTCTERGVCLTAYQYNDPPLRYGVLCQRLWQRTQHLEKDGFKRLNLEHHHQTGDDDDTYIHKLWPSAFADHKGNRAFTIWEDHEPCTSLYPLISFSIYFTHPAAGDPRTDMPGLFSLIRQEIVNFYFRLDFYFLPNASRETCMAHYRAEMANAPSYHDVLDLVERRLRTRLTQSPRSMCRSITDEFTFDGRRWRGALCICTGENRTETGETLECLLFDCSDDDDEAVSSSTITTTWNAFLPISSTSPGAGTTGETAATWMWDLAYPFRDRCVEARKQAMERDWGYWA
ncbi:hypothetical protein BJX63DRAFT_434740 [Aspergillus granulosus]|uniref:Uncharacterized protein n=1 Tax=Aspergillus granulosus TaxID=176169 RepID=A0ABR4H3S7_9EURO